MFHCKFQPVPDFLAGEFPIFPANFSLKFLVPAFSAGEFHIFPVSFNLAFLILRSTHFLRTVGENHSFQKNSSLIFLVLVSWQANFLFFL